MAQGEQQKTAMSEQELGNSTFDPTFGVNAMELLGYDSGANVLRRVAVNASGNLSVQLDKLTSTANQSTLTLTDDGSDQTLTGDLGILNFAGSTSYAYDAPVDIDVGSDPAFAITAGNLSGGQDLFSAFKTSLVGDLASFSVIIDGFTKWPELIMSGANDDFIIDYHGEVTGGTDTWEITSFVDTIRIKPGNEIFQVAGKFQIGGDGFTKFGGNQGFVEWSHDGTDGYITSSMGQMYIPQLVLPGSSLRSLGDSTTEVDVRRTVSDLDNTNVTGSGAVEIGGDFSNATDLTYKVEITTGGDAGTAIYRWSDDGGSTWDESNITTSITPRTMNNGLKVWFTIGAGTDFNTNDYATITAIGTDNQNNTFQVDTTNNKTVLAGDLTIANSQLSLVTSANHPTGAVNIQNTYTGIEDNRAILVRAGLAGGGTASSVFALDLIAYSDNAAYGCDARALATDVEALAIGGRFAASQATVGDTNAEVIGGHFKVGTQGTAKYSIGGLFDSAANLGNFIGINGDWAGYFRGDVNVVGDITANTVFAVFGSVKSFGDSTTEVDVRRTIKDLTKTGTGGGDLNVSGDFSNAADKSYKVEITTGGEVGSAIFRWSDDGGSTWDEEGIITRSERYELNHDISLQFTPKAGDTDFDTNDFWTFTAIGTNNQLNTFIVDTTNNQTLFGGDATIDGDLIIDNTSTEALIVRKNTGGDQAFLVDTTNLAVYTRRLVSLNDTFYNVLNETKIVDTVADAFDSNYTLSVQSDSTATYVEILNDGGTGKGAFLSIENSGGGAGLGDYFSLYNWQGGPIRFYTETTASAGTLRFEIEPDGDFDFKAGDMITTGTFGSGNITISGTNPILTFDDTTGGANDWTLNVDGDKMTVAPDTKYGANTELVLDAQIDLRPSYDDTIGQIGGTAVLKFNPTITIDSLANITAILFQPDLDYDVGGTIAFTGLNSGGTVTNATANNATWRMFNVSASINSSTAAVPPVKPTFYRSAASIVGNTANVGTLDYARSFEHACNYSTGVGATMILSEFTAFKDNCSVLAQGTQTLTTWRGLHVSGEGLGGAVKQISDLGTLTIVDKIGVDIESSEIGLGAPTFTNQYGIRVGDLTSATNNFGITLESDDAGGGALWFGAGQDAKMYYDGTDMNIDTDLVAASDLVIDCGTNKTIELEVPVYKDINIGSGVLSLPVATQPDEVEIDDENGDGTGIYTWGFAEDELVSGVFEIQHDYKEGTDLVFHVHWSGNDSPTGTDHVKWELTYTVTQTGATIDPSTTISVETAYDTRYEMVSSSFPAITGTNFNIEDQVYFTLKRVAPDGANYMNKDALVATIGIHYQVDTIGSRQVTTK